MFRKVLIANRGEIAVRVMRTLREMGIATVAVYSDADRTSLHVRMADEAEHVGPSPSAESYLRIDRILDAARKHGAEAIHPGYGFLSENADFAAACEDAGLVFIGPSAASIRAHGLEDRRAPARPSPPARPWCPAPSTASRSTKRASSAREHGYPILLKAVAGGGGKGMRRVDREAELESALRDAASEAERAFRNPEIYVEKLIERPAPHRNPGAGRPARQHGAPGRARVLHPAPPSEGDGGVPVAAGGARIPRCAQAMGEAAIRAARAAGYYNAGTVEFLVDQDRRFYFLEMNTRLQVEHPVTELVTGLDLVRLQVEIAAGERLPFAQEEVAWRGSAIECRIYAEDPYNNFLPYPGKLTRLTRPLGPGHPPGRLRLRRLDGSHGVRSAAGQAGRLGRHARRRHRPHDPRPARIRRGRHPHQHRLLPPDSGRPGIPRRPSAHRLHRRILRAPPRRRARAGSGRRGRAGAAALHTVERSTE